MLKRPPLTKRSLWMVSTKSTLWTLYTNTQVVLVYWNKVGGFVPAYAVRELHIAVQSVWPLTLRLVRGWLGVLPSTGTPLTPISLDPSPLSWNELLYVRTEHGEETISDPEIIHATVLRPNGVRRIVFPGDGIQLGDPYAECLAVEVDRSSNEGGPHTTFDLVCCTLLLEYQGP